MSIRNCILLLLLLNKLALANAQVLNQLGDKYIYTVYNKAQGLNAGAIYDIVQDSSSFIWVATDNGLYRFDGKTFVRFTTDDGLPSNEVIKLFVGKDNKLWIGTLKPVLCCYSNGVFISIKDEQKLIKRELLSFGLDDKGNVICCDGLSVLRFKNNKLQVEASGKEERIEMLAARIGPPVSVNEYKEEAKYGYVFDSFFFE